MLGFVGKKRSRREALAEAIYGAVVAAARAPALYASMGVPDTVTGRFEMVAFHAFLAMRRLKGLGSEGGALAQAVFDRMFADMDRSLREMGAGDLGVGRRVKAMAQQFYGRVVAYERGLAQGDLEAALSRNVLDGGDASALADYARRAAAAIAREDGLLAGRCAFPDPAIGPDEHP